MSITKLIGVLAVSMMTLLAGAESSRAGIVVNFSGTVTSFQNDVTIPQPGGFPVTMPGITDIGPGSTFEGKVSWSYDPTAFSGHSEVYFPVPIIEFSVDHKYLFSSEMVLSTLGHHGGYGVTDFPSVGPGTEEILFVAGHADLQVGISAELYVMTASATAAADPHGPVEALITHDLTNFVSGQFIFGYSDFNGGHLFYNTEGHRLELQGNVTSLSVRSTTPIVPSASTPEPSTIVSAGIAGLVGLGLARRRRRAKVSA